MGKTLGKISTIIAIFILMVTCVAVKPSLAGEETSDGRFIAYDDGTVWDTLNDLLWAARDNGSNINWEDAKFYCENYSEAGYDDWRMPTRDELKGLYDRLLFGNNGYHLTKLITLTGSFLWSSYVQGSEAAIVGFGNDRDIWFWESATHKSRIRVLPVRNGKEGKVVASEPPQEVVAPPPPPPPVPQAPEPPPPPPVKEKVTLSLNLEFDTAKSLIKAKYHSNIKKVADFMQQYPDTNVIIEGHTDDVDVFKNPENNVKLSQARANSVRQYLIDKFGIAAARITAFGYGPNRPIADNKTKEGRQRNRRVDAIIETVVTK